MYKINLLGIDIFTVIGNKGTDNTWMAKLIILTQLLVNSMLLFLSIDYGSSWDYLLFTFFAKRLSL